MPVLHSSMGATGAGNPYAGAVVSRGLADMPSSLLQPRCLPAALAACGRLWRAQEGWPWQRGGTTSRRHDLAEAWPRGGATSWRHGLVEA